MWRSSLAQTRFEKISFGLLVAAWILWGSYQAGGLLVNAQELKTPAYSVEIADAEPAKASATAIAQEDTLTLLAATTPPKGEKVFKKCKSCHTVNKGGKNMVGPNLWDVIGRTKGSISGYSYSNSLKNMGGDWSYANLDAFLLSPKKYAKGTKMSFSGLKKAEDRAAVIVYLRSLSDSPKPLP